MLERIRHQLEQNSDPHIKDTGLKYFKEKVNIYGVKTSIVRKIAKLCGKEIIGMSKKDVFALCEELWQSGYMEESFIACHFAYLIRKNFEAADFKIFENWLENYISNWAACDTLCNQSELGFI
jgi:3-methyladenine DNA glycosylase AlkD